jgi:hypothetical protein
MEKKSNQKLFFQIVFVQLIGIFFKAFKAVLLFILT